MFVLTSTLSFEIAENDLDEKYEWLDAKNACSILGERWRVPTSDELKEIFRLHQKGIGNFKMDIYWSSTGINNYCAFCLSFSSGRGSENFNAKNPMPKCCVRPVRNI